VFPPRDLLLGCASLFRGGHRCKRNLELRDAVDASTT
jgi:hypothetical protein